MCSINNFNSVCKLASRRQAKVEVGRKLLQRNEAGGRQQLGNHGAWQQGKRGAWGDLDCFAAGVRSLR